LQDQTYYTYAICENYDGYLSNFTYTTWNNTYNQGMATLIYFEFTTPLKKKDLSKLARALVFNFKLKDYQVFTDYGDQLENHDDTIQSDPVFLSCNFQGYR
jgi:hypothetical protein